MSRYFFDVDENDNAVLDREGCICASISEARRIAVSLASQHLSSGTWASTGGALLVSIRDDDAAIVATLRMVCQLEPVA